MICEKCIHNAVCKYGEARSNGFYCTGEKCKQFRSESNVAKNIFEELESIPKDQPSYVLYVCLTKKIAELKKKYESEGADDEH